MWAQVRPSRDTCQRFVFREGSEFAQICEVYHFISDFSDHLQLVIRLLQRKLPHSHSYFVGPVPCKGKGILRHAKGFIKGEALRPSLDVALSSNLIQTNLIL